MGLRKIEPGMVIHCRTEEEARALLEWAYECGYEWMSGIPKEHTAFSTFGKYTCYSFSESGKILFAEKAYIEKHEKKEAIDFSALVLPELTAAEILDAFWEICASSSCYDGGCCLDGIYPAHMPFRHQEYSSGAVIEACRKWIAAHGKKGPGKEPRIETVDVCRIIEILPDGSRRCVHEADIEPDASFGGERLAAEEILKTYCMGHEGDFIAVHEVVSRIKKE